MSRGMGSRAPPLPGPSPAARAALMAAGASPSGVREPPPLPGPSPAARAAALSVGARHDSGADSSARLVVTGEASGIKLGVITLDSPPPEPCSECGLQDRDLLLHNDPSKGALYYCRECWALVEDMTALKEIACACQPPAASYDWAHRCEDCGKCDAHGRVDDDDGNFYCSACWALSEECAADRARAADYVSVCNECGAVGLGDLDDSDDQFYCNDCWAAIGLRPGSSSASASTSNLPPPLPGPSPAARAAALLQTPSPSGNGTGGRESARATGRSGTAFKLEVSDLNDHYISQPHAHNAAPSAVPPPTVCAATASRQQDLGSKSDGKDKGWRIRLPVREVMREQKVRQVLHDEQMRDEVVEAQAERASTGQAYTCSEWSACGPSGLSEGAGIGYDVGRNGDKGVRGDGDEGRGKEDCAQQTRQQQQQVMTQKQMQQERMREWKEWEAMRRRREEEELRAHRQKEEEERRRAAELWRLMAEDEREKQRLLEKDLQQQQQQQQQQIETAQRPRRLYESFVPGEQQGEDREEEEKGALGSASCQGGDIKESSENGSNGRRERRHKAASGRRFNVKVLVRALKASIGPWSAQSDVTDVTEGALTHSKQEVDHALIGSTHASANGSSQGCAAPPSCPDTLRRPKDVKTNAGHEALSKDMKTNAALEEHRAKRRERGEEAWETLAQPLSVEEKRRMWTEEILPAFDKHLRKKWVHALWRMGIPEEVRREVWLCAVGNSMQLTCEHYHAVLARVERGEIVVKSIDLIRHDVPRTRLRDGTHSRASDRELEGLLRAVSALRPEQGYVQGMSVLGAFLLECMHVADAFVCLGNLLGLRYFPDFLSMRADRIEHRYRILDELVQAECPELAAHLRGVGFSSGLLLTNWWLTLYSRHFTRDLVGRLWDCFLLEGEPLLYRAALAVLKTVQARLLGQPLEVCLAVINKSGDDMTVSSFFDALSRVGVAPKTIRQLLDAYPPPCISPPPHNTEASAS